MEAAKSLEFIQGDTKITLKGKVLGCAFIGVVTVAAVAAYGASVVLSGDTTLAAAPSLVLAIIGFGTAMAGSMYVLNKAESDIQSQQNSGILDYVYEALVGREE